MLTDKVRVEQANEILEPEDIFAEATNLFPDETRNIHGDPGAAVVYSSRFGDLRLTTADPGSEDDRKLFAHYLWNASIYCAQLIEEEPKLVEAESVLELGAGVGLVSILAALSGCPRVVTTDYPAVEIIENLQKNIRSNLPQPLQEHVSVVGHAWGKLDDELADQGTQSFSRIFAADCFWMPWEHRNLAKSMVHSLSRTPSARVYAVAGFHTGRAKLAPFFDIAQEEGLQIDSIEEVDVNGDTRPWSPVRDGGMENVTERKRWLVVAVLKHARPEPQ